ncbi:hypothetical protein GA0115234_107614 [Streptomyces sp. DvalAA-43]|nr:hypothetical protein GA0115234_107614 [Streptomyces sp. DvalAA-43]
MDCFFGTVGPGLASSHAPAGTDKAGRSSALLRRPAGPWPTVPRAAWVFGAAANRGRRLAVVVALLGAVPDKYAVLAAHAWVAQA